MGHWQALARAGRAGLLPIKIGRRTKDTLISRDIFARLVLPDKRLRRKRRRRRCQAPPQGLALHQAEASLGKPRGIIGRGGDGRLAKEPLGLFEGLARGRNPESARFEHLVLDD